jgi:cob(I)alamin adenosyltransferase
MISKRKLKKNQSNKTMANHHKQGLIIVYTGNGKGKTTAAVGLAVRAAGYKRKVLFLQFIKEWFTGEKESFKILEPYVTFVQMGQGFVGIWGDRKDRTEHENAASEAFEFLKDKIKSNEYEVIVMDEINVAIAEGLIKIDEVMEMISSKPAELDLVFTGRGADPRLIEVADLVTEMTEIKHPFQKGILAKRSIDY